MKKLILTQKEKNKFKKDYSTGVIESEYILNIYYLKSPGDALSKLLSLTSESEYGRVLGLIYNKYLESMLKDNFGEPDYVFRGFEEYSNYLFEHRGVTFIASSKTEYVIDKGVDKSVYINAMGEYLQEIHQMVIDYFFTQKIPTHMKKDIKNAIDEGFYIDGKINWEWSEEFKTAYLEQKLLNKNLSVAGAREETIGITNKI